MKFVESNSVKLNTTKTAPYITFPVLSNLDYIKHGFTTRLGGVSEGYYQSMNLSYSVGDEKERVDANYRIMCDSLGIRFEDVVATHQVHKTNVRLITKEDRGKGLYLPRDYEEIDGFVTNTPNIPLATFYADCVPLLFVDTKRHAIGLSHSGWRGTVGKMGKATIDAMKAYFHTDPLDVIAVIGPSICKDCYEVDQTVYEEFERTFDSYELSQIITKSVTASDKYQLNLWEANKQILVREGLQDKNIHICGVCTSCNEELLFSHRASKGKRGTLAAFLMLES